jgi:hypothetical protein
VGGALLTWFRLVTAAVTGLVLAGCTYAAPAVDFTCDEEHLRVAWRIPAKLASLALTGPDGISLMTEEIEVPVDQPAERWENTYEWVRNDITPPGDYGLRLIVDGRRSHDVVTCP